MIIKAQLIDIFNRVIKPVSITIHAGKIASIEASNHDEQQYILPPFTDAHVHIESSMLVPSAFAKLAVIHGSVATVSDPHEIANVLGIDGVKYMIKNGQQTPFKFCFGAPSCVPATTFETAGAVVDANDIRELLAMDEVLYLTEMMNYPGVLFDDPVVLEKIAIAKEMGKPIDGHAPGLRGDDARKYAAAGISTDHECFTYAEAKEKIGYGMKILIREGSAARNFEALHPLISEHPDKVMLCSDDKHPDDLIEGHINQLVARAIAKGHDLFDVLQAACINPVLHYNLPVGLLRVGDHADFVLLDNLETFEVNATYINGQKVAKNGQSFIADVDAAIINNFATNKKNIQDFAIPALSNQIKVIRAIDGELVTESFIADATIKDGCAISNTTTDVLKMAVVNRYQDAAPALCFINGFNLRKGAIASCVGHDSHNIIVVGCNDEDMTKAINLIIENKGGIAAVDGDTEMVLPLPVAGIMTTADGVETGVAYSKIDRWTKQNLACTLRAPFMTLSFMALLVIPALKLSDKGLFDGQKFEFTDLFV